MTNEEIFSLLDSHMIKGMMFHQQMKDYFDFLNMRGYKLLHEYRFFEESKELQDLHSYYISTYCKLITQKEVGDPEVIPTNWYRYSKTEIGPGDKYKFVLSGFDKWVKWETDTKKLYKTFYKELNDNGEYATANKILTFICEVNSELALAREMYLKVYDCDGDLDYILSEQMSVEECYRECLHHVI